MSRRDVSLEAAVDEAMRAWSSIRLPVAGFRAHVRERLGADDDITSLRLADLYLAYGCLQGSTAAWKELDRLHLSRVPSFVARIDSSPAFGEEVRQRLAEKLARTDGENRPRLALYSGRGALGGWLRVAAVREAHDLRRATKSVPEEEGVELVDANDTPEAKLAKRHYAAAFKTAFEEVLSALDSDRRNVLRLHYLEGLTLVEVGRAYGVSRATAARWIAEAREAILDRVGSSLDEKLGQGAAGAVSVFNYVNSQLDLSLQRQFSMHDTGPLSDD